MTRSGLRILAYGLYDWAQSPMPTLHTTFIFAVYFATAVMPEGGSVAWAWLNAATAICIALAAPLLGVIADQYGWRKAMLFITSLGSIIAVSLIWYIKPDPSFALMAILLSAGVMICGELAFVFYHALLPAVAPPERLGRVSGLAWGMGYFGAIFCLLLALVVFIFPDTPPFGLSKEQAEPVRATMPLAGLWFLIFALPVFLFVPEGRTDRSPFKESMVKGWHVVRQTPGMLRFLMARLLYADALVTLFAMGGIFAARIHDFSQQDVIIFAIILNITAGLGAVIGGRADDRLGSIQTIRICLIALIVLGLLAIVVTSPLLFWVVGSLIGFFVGPLQSASRSHVLRLTPVGVESRVFGFFMLTGKATAFIGPFIYGGLVLISGSDRIGMLVVVALLIGGLILLRPTHRA